jgi:hypothetical protein
MVRRITPTSPPMIGRPVFARPMPLVVAVAPATPPEGEGLPPGAPPVPPPGVGLGDAVGEGLGEAYGDGLGDGPAPTPPPGVGLGDGLGDEVGTVVVHPRTRIAPPMSPFWDSSPAFATSNWK